MKYVANILTIIFFLWPAVIVGYLFEAVRTGFEYGVLKFDDHCEASDAKFVKKELK